MNSKATATSCDVYVEKRVFHTIVVPRDELDKHVRFHFIDFFF
mgnify:CR=1 FL=1